MEVKYGSFQKTSLKEGWGARFASSSSSFPQPEAQNEEVMIRRREPLLEEGRWHQKEPGSMSLRGPRPDPGLPASGFIYMKEN